MKPMEALCSGSAWAALTHSLLGSETDLEGFILGEVVQKVEISAQDEGMDKHEALSVLRKPSYSCSSETLWSGCWFGSSSSFLLTKDIKGFRASIPNRFRYFYGSIVSIFDVVSSFEGECLNL